MLRTSKLPAASRLRANVVARRFAYRFFGVLLLVALAAGAAAAADAQTTPLRSLGSLGPDLPFAVADFDGDLRPDLAGVQIGRNNLSGTDYWIQFQLTSAGPQRILVVAPAGGLQIAARDVNGDDAPDLVVTTSWLKQPVAILLNDGHGGFSRVDPSAFPGAFTESKSNWNSTTEQSADAAGVPTQSRNGICWETARLPRGQPRISALLPSSSGFPVSPCLLCRLGRAPPLQAPLA